MRHAPSGAGPLLVVLAALWAGGATALGAVESVADPGCSPAGSLGFVCGAGQPEDLARVPATRWLVVSGYSAGSGLKLLDTRTRELRRWSADEPEAIAFDRTRYPHCPGPPDASRMNIQGLSLRAEGGEVSRLLASNHGGREAIEAFHVRADPADPDSAPRLQWIGCLPMPEGLAANAVASFPDGTVLVTVLTLPGRSMADYVLGRDTGVVLAWAPGAAGFSALLGTGLPGNNGIEAGDDNRHFYVVAFGRHAIVGFERRGRHARKLFEAIAPGFMPDNIHWDGHALLAAGMQYDEPACGGRRKVIGGAAEAMTCHRGYSAARLDPDTLQWQLVAYDVPNPSFNGVSTAVIVDGILWLGSYQSDRLAYRAP